MGCNNRIDWDDEWFISHLNQFSTMKELFAEYNRVHNTDYAYHTMKSHIYDKGIKSVNRCSTYSNEEIEFFRTYYSTMFTDAFLTSYNAQFDKKLSKTNITVIARRLGLKKTSEQMQRALQKTLSATTYKDGTVGWLSKGKYEHIKTKDGWMLRSRYEYQKFTGETLTKADAIIFADGNTTNYSEDNLVKVPAKYVTLIYGKDQLAISNDNKYLLDAAIMWCDLYTKIKEAQSQQ